MTHAPEISLLLQVLDEAYDKKSWHGPNLRGSMRGVGWRLAGWRPQPQRHNIWEHTVHAAYWKYVVRRRIRQEKRGSFPLKGSDWFPRPQEATEQAWQADLALLAEMHRQLREVVENMEPSDLERAGRTGTLSFRSLLTGVAAHDLYHAGQIQLLKRLQAAEVAE